MLLSSREFHDEGNGIPLLMSRCPTWGKVISGSGVIGRDSILTEPEFGLYSLPVNVQRGTSG